MTINLVSSVTNIHLRNKMVWWYTPWIIVISSFLINLMIAVLVNNKAIYSGGVAAIYVYMLVLGIVTLNQTFPFAIGFSIRRRDYFYGTTAMVFLTSLIFTVLLSLLSVIENNLFGSWGGQLYFFHIPYFNEGNIFVQSWVIFTIMVYLFYLGFFISSIYRRFGKVGLTIYTIVILLVGSVFSAVFTYFGWWMILFSKISNYTAFQLSWWLIPFIMVDIIFSYFMLRKATI
jgi:hypothetical protein